MNDLISFLTPEGFATAREGVVELGKAPDGLRLLVQVHRRGDAEELLGATAGLLGIEHPAPGFAGTPLASLVERLEGLLDDQLVQRLTTHEGEAIKAIVLPGEVAQISGPTLLARLFGASRAWPGGPRLDHDTRTVEPHPDASAAEASAPGSVSPPPGSVPPAPIVPVR